MEYLDYGILDLQGDSYDSEQMETEKPLSFGCCIGNYKRGCYRFLNREWKTCT